MKTIKIFFASSEELEDDRNAFGNLVRRLNKSYQKRGIELDLFDWRDYDAAYNDRRKQDEYNDNVRESDIFLAVFHRVAGRYTIEEFDIATEEFRKKSLPKTYVYCKDLKDGETESSELKKFKQRLIEEMGHYWSRYSNRDTMQLHFVMQLQMVESSGSDALKVEDGNVVLDGLHIARMENLPFVGLNEDFQKMSARLAELPAQIENFRMLNEQMPGQEFIQNELQKALNEYNQLKEDFEKHQQALFVTAKRIAQLQGQRITDRMRRAMEAFNEGKVREANIILEEAERDGQQALKEYKQSKELTAQKRQNVVQSIDELLLKSATILADHSMPAEERIAKVEDIYAQADAMAQEIDLEPEKYDELLFDYGDFLRDYGKYGKAEEIYSRSIALCEALYGVEHVDTATSYNNIGLVYSDLADYDKALEYYHKALAIQENVLGKNHPDTANSYNNIGAVYSNTDDYNKALEYYYKALAIDEKVLGVEHPSTAISYNNIGLVYDSTGDYNKALEYYYKALAILEKVLGVEHPATAISYNNIGEVYRNTDDYEKALEYHHKALAIREKVLGVEHPDTATSYNNIGLVYDSMGDYNKALEYYHRALVIREKVLGVEHPRTAISYNNIGEVYKNTYDYNKALEYFNKALDIQTKVLGSNHPHTKTVAENILYCTEALKHDPKKKSLAEASTWALRMWRKTITFVRNFKP